MQNKAVSIILQVHLSLATMEGGSRTKNMTSAGGCSYSFVHS